MVSECVQVLCGFVHTWTCQLPCVSVGLQKTSEKQPRYRPGPASQALHGACMSLRVHALRAGVTALRNTECKQLSSVIFHSFKCTHTVLQSTRYNVCAKHARTLQTIDRHTQEPGMSAPSRSREIDSRSSGRPPVS
jgi:hypothetical protein